MDDNSRKRREAWEKSVKERKASGKTRPMKRKKQTNRG